MERWRTSRFRCHVRDIADYIGLTMETVSRTISLIAHQKAIVVVPDGVRILDLDRLALLAGE